MRRSLASLLLALWMTGICLPLLQSQPDLPACCRRDGMHHCAMHWQGAGFHATGGACPYQHFTAVAVRQITALTASHQAPVAGSRICDHVCADLPVPVLLASYTVPKRGPPAI